MMKQAIIREFVAGTGSCFTFRRPHVCTRSVLIGVVRMRRAAVLSVVAVLSFTAFAGCRARETAKAAPATPATQAPAASTDPKALTGTVAETMNSGGYTYARLQVAGKNEVWIAAREFPTKAGDQLSVTLDMPMENFESKTLHRTFPVVYFVAGVMRDGQRVDPSSGGAEGANPGMMTSHAPASVPTTVEPIAAPAGGMSIADVWAKRESLAGRSVTVRGKVVKVNNGIMGRNWVHLQDGSGSAKDQTNDLTITTDTEVAVGDVVTFSGVLAVDKDFTAGYKYGAILESAKRGK
jgi:hypothetical protein